MNSPASSRPRILVVIPRLAVGGTERHLLSVMPRLAAKGYAITIFTTQGEGPLDSAFLDLGVEIVHAPVKSDSWFKPWSWLKATNLLYALLRRQKPDIVHFFLPEAYIIGGLSALLAGTRQCVMSRRSLNNYQRQHKYAAHVEGLLHRRMTAVLANSMAVYRDLEQEGVPESRLSIISNGVDVEAFAPADKLAARKSLNIPEGALVFVCVANLISYKGHTDLIEALGNISKRLPRDWQLLLIGRDEGIGSELRQHAANAGIAEHIRWVGEQTDVRPHLHAADIGVLASHEEGSPNSVLETMATALPMVATAVGGSAEAIVDGITGHLVPPRDPQALGDTLLTLAEDPQTRQQQSTAARGHVLARFQLDDCIAQYDKFYAGLIQREIRSKQGAAAQTRQASQPFLGHRARILLQIAFSLALLVVALYFVLGRVESGSLYASFDKLPVSAFLFAGVALTMGALLASTRIKLIARDFGFHLSWAEAGAALGLGQLGGAAFFQVAGQLIARGGYLSRRGLPLGATVIMVGYEKFLALGVSLVLAAVGAWHLFGRLALDIEQGGDELLKLAAGLILATLAGAWFGWHKALPTRIVGLISASAIRRVSRNAVLSLIIQLATMLAYLVIVRALAADIPLPDLASAIAVVMLTASLPISFAGWGVRELSAVLALSAIGVPPAAALLTAIIIGVGSLLVVMPLIALALNTRPRDTRPPLTKPGIGIDYTRTVSMVISLAVATAVFFHLLIPTEAGGLNVNLADPLAVLGGALFVIFCATRRNGWPAWRLPGFNLHLIAATAVMTAALLIGAERFGWTDWALTNKFLGWFILLGYGATGALIVAVAGKDGRRLLFWTFAAAGMAIASLEIFLIIVDGAGFTLSKEVLWYDATGFARNRNSFAFQILMVLATTLAMAPRRSVIIVVSAISIACLWYAGSRAGWLAAMALFGVAWYIRTSDLKTMAAAIAGSVLLIVAVAFGTGLIALGYETLAGQLEGGVGESFKRSADLANQLTRIIYNETTTAHRLKSLTGGLALFRDYPLFGAGLGAYVANELRTTGEPLVIHATAIWLLAETGLVGLLVFLAPVARIFRSELIQATRDESGKLLILIIVVFATMTIGHEMLYQRTFWLLLGAALAVPFENRSRPPLSAQQ